MLSVTVAVCDFGWGSVGKLRLILDELRARCGDTVRILAELESMDLIGRVIPQHAVEPRTNAEYPELGLVVNDPSIANSLTDSQIPVLYVDSLPYLWTTPEEVPRSVDCYCAQVYPAAIPISKSSPLRNRSNITWISPIVPPSGYRKGGGGVVINVGGLHSHLSEFAAQAYLDVVLIPLVQMLVARGIRIAAVCGNLGDSISGEISTIVGDLVPVGGQTAGDFEHTLSLADVLLTSPGSTTILQASSIRLPTAFLPAQNLSQILNAEIYATPRTPRSEWPDAVLDRNLVERLRPRGEDTVLNYIYQSIAEAAHSVSARSAIAHALGTCVEFAFDPYITLDNLMVLGTGGAREIVDIMEQRVAKLRIESAPMPRSE